MKTILDRIDKNRLMINSIVNTYFQVDQSLQLFKHLIDNDEFLKRWEDSYSESGVNSLRFSLYMSILAEMRAIMFDQGKKVASVHGTIETLKDYQFVKHLKIWFCDVSESEIISIDGSLSESGIEAIKENDYQRKVKAFDELLSSTLSAYQELTESELCFRVNSARNKMISHKEFQTAIYSERRMYEAQDFGLKYSDAENIVEKSQHIIFNIYSLFTKSYFDPEHSLKHHERVAKEFWSKSIA
tara:strand:- start:219 stop:947 length:729 start_codon:yes stop_codon:yes gene_type:complete